MTDPQHAVAPLPVEPLQPEDYERAARGEGWTVDGGMFVHHNLHTVAEASPLDPEGWDMLCREQGIHAADAPTMVPQPVQQQQGRDVRADAGSDPVAVAPAYTLRQGREVRDGWDVLANGEWHERFRRKADAIKCADNLREEIAAAAVKASARAPSMEECIAATIPGHPVNLQWEARARAREDEATMVPQPCQQQQAQATRPVRVSIRDNVLGGLWQGEGVTPEAAFNRARVDAPRAGMGTDTRDAFSAAWLHHSNGQAVSSATRGDVTVTIEAAITTVQQP